MLLDIYFSVPLIVYLHLYGNKQSVTKISLRKKSCTHYGKQ